MAELLFRYLQTRILRPKIGALLAFLFLLVVIVAPDRSAGSLFFEGLLLAIVTIQFRLWDDLADLNYDRAYAPDRILTQVPTLRPFYRFCILLGGVSGVLIFTARSPA